MNHPPYVHRQSIASDFLTYGNDGIGLNRAAELRASDLAATSVAATLPSTTAFGSIRRLVGNLLIVTGTALAGAVPDSTPSASRARTA
jgi:hypothetical protein